MFSSCNPKLFAVKHIHYPVTISTPMQWCHLEINCCTETVLSPSDHYCIETVAPPGDHYCINIAVPSSDHRCTEKVPPSRDHHGTTEL